MRFVIFRHPKDKPNENPTKSFCSGTCPDDILLFPSVFFLCFVRMFSFSYCVFNVQPNEIICQKDKCFCWFEMMRSSLSLNENFGNAADWLNKKKKNARVVWTEYIIPVEILQRKYFKWLNSIFCASQIDSCLRPLFVIYLRLAWLYHVSVFYFFIFLFVVTSNSKQI